MQITQSGHKLQLHLTDAETLKLIADLTKSLIARQTQPKYVAYHETSAIHTKDQKDSAAVVQFFVGKI